MWSNQFTLRSPQTAPDMPLQACRHGGQPPQSSGTILDFGACTPFMVVHVREVPSSNWDQSMVQDVRVTVLVTDSNSGIGKVCAQQPAKRDTHVILSGRNKARGDAAAAESGRPEGRPTSLPPTRRTQPRPRPLRDNPPTRRRPRRRPAQQRRAVPFAPIRDLHLLVRAGRGVRSARASAGL